MIGSLVPHRKVNPRWCMECIHPTTGKYSKARWIWVRPGLVDVFLCSHHAEEIRQM